jgi:hypothetical protein
MKQDWDIFEENNYEPLFSVKLGDAVIIIGFALFFVAIAINVFF